MKASEDIEAIELGNHGKSPAVCGHRPLNAVVIAGNSFAVDNAGARAQPGQRFDDQREATGEIVAWTTIEPHPLAILAGNDTEAVVLNLMQPQAAGR